MKEKQGEKENLRKKYSRNHHSRFVYPTNFIH